MQFLNRKDAGKQLAKMLEKYSSKDTVIYALPRGGVVLGFEIAKNLNTPLDLIITRKIGHPLNPEYAICATNEQGDLLCNEAEKNLLDPNWLLEEVKNQIKEALRRRKIYLGDKKHIEANGKTAIIVDDGIATGLTMELAIKSLKNENPKKIIVAVPVAPHDIILNLSKKADEVVVIEDAKYYSGSVGAYYKDFPQVSDQEVIELMKNINN